MCDDQTQAIKGAVAAADAAPDVATKRQQLINAIVGLNRMLNNPACDPALYGGVARGREVIQGLAARVRALSSVPVPMDVVASAPAPVQTTPAAPPATGAVTCKGPGGTWYDSLPQTLDRKPDQEAYPCLSPWNYPGNPRWDRSVTFANTFGAAKAKRLLQTTIVDQFLLPHLYPSALAQRGFMLYGVPGTGKTRLATGVVNATQDAPPRTGAELAKLRNNPQLRGFVDAFWPDGRVPQTIFYSVGVTDVVSAFIGESAKRLTRWFQLARATEPSVIFFDEADVYLDPNVKSNSEPITVFKQQVGGLGAGGVTVILATNYPMRIESAVRSRVMAGAIEVPVPDLAARKKIIELQLDTAQKRNATSTYPLTKFYINTGTPTQTKEKIIDFVADATRPRPSEGKAWSSRDIVGLINAALRLNRDRVARGCLVECARGSPGSKACEYYANVDDVYVLADEQPAPRGGDMPQGCPRP